MRKMAVWSLIAVSLSSLTPVSAHTGGEGSNVPELEEGARINGLAQASAQTVGSWNAVEALERGRRIRMTTTAEVTDGYLVSSGPERVVMVSEQALAASGLELRTVVRSCAHVSDEGLASRLIVRGKEVDLSVLCLDVRRDAVVAVHDWKTSRWLASTIGIAVGGVMGGYLGLVGGQAASNSSEASSSLITGIAVGAGIGWLFSLAAGMEEIRMLYEAPPVGERWLEDWRGESSERLAEAYFAQ